MSSYVKGADNQYHIFQLVELKEAHQIPFDEKLQETIKTKLIVDRLRQIIDEFTSKAQIQKFPERLEGIQQ